MDKEKKSFLKTKYMEMQKNKIDKVLKKDGNIFSAFHMAYNKNSIESFIEYMEENGLTENFIKESFDNLANFSNIEGDTKKEKDIFVKITETKGIEYLQKVYGNEVGQKLQNLYNDNKINFMDIYQIANINRKENITQQANIIGKVLDLCKEDFVIGIHRTAGLENAGKIINNEGIKLTGHQDSGVDSREYTDIKNKLSQNISFDYRPGLLIRQIATGGNYKNIEGKQFVDISIVAIPKEEFTKEKQNIIIENQESNRLMLNPEFVAGYITVDSKTSTLENYVENSKYKSLNKEKVSEETKAWLQRLDKWDNQTRNSGIRNTLMSIFKKLSPKNKIKKNKENKQEIPKNVSRETYEEER